MVSVLRLRVKIFHGGGADVTHAANAQENSH